MRYQTFEPTEDLMDFVACYWTLDSERDEPASRQTIVPDGCMEMIFHYGDLYRQYREEAGWIVQPRCFVIGQLTQPLEIEATGATGIFSVRFHPNGFMPFATRPLKEMENTAVPLEALFAESGKRIGDQVCAATSTARRIAAVEQFLLSRLTDNATIDRLVKSVVDTILTANGQLSIDEVSKQTHIGRRQLERKFAAAIGLSPKQLSKTIRLQHALKILLSTPVTSLTALAHQGAYYDQAHFIKDFKEITGFTPKEFYGDTFKMSALFFGSE